MKNKVDLLLPIPKFLFINLFKFIIKQTSFIDPNFENTFSISLRETPAAKSDT